MNLVAQKGVRVGCAEHLLEHVLLEDIELAIGMPVRFHGLRDFPAKFSGYYLDDLLCVPHTVIEELHMFHRWVAEREELAVGVEGQAPSHTRGQMAQEGGTEIPRGANAPQKSHRQRYHTLARRILRRRRLWV